MKRYKSKQSNIIKARKKALITFIIVITLSALAIGTYTLTKDAETETTNRTSSEKGETQPTNNSNGKTPSLQNNQGLGTNGDKNGGSTTPTTSSAPPAAPSGTFISNHHPNLGGTPAPNRVQSTCITTPGAKCNIVLTRGDVVKSLGDQYADADGAVYWEWTLQDKGLAEGTWKVTAVATLNGQTASTDDPTPLEVKL